MLLAGYGIDLASKVKPKYSIAQAQNYCYNYFNTSSEVTEEFKKAWKTIDITKNYQIGYYAVYSYKVEDTLSTKRTEYYMDGKVYNLVYDPNRAVSNQVHDKTTKVYFSDYASPTWTGWKTMKQIEYNWNDPTESIHPIEKAELNVFENALFTKEENKKKALGMAEQKRESLYSTQKIVGTKYTTTVLFFPILTSTFKLNGKEYKFWFDLYRGERKVFGITDTVKTSQHLTKAKIEKQTQNVKNEKKSYAENILCTVMKYVDYFRFGCIGLSALVFLLAIFTSVEGFTFATFGGYFFLVAGGFCTWMAGATSSTFADGDFDNLEKFKMFKIVVRCIRNAWKPILFALLGLILLWVSSTFFCGENLLNRAY